jgi:dihydroorotate dehydrogenase electron transfer subunit
VAALREALARSGDLAPGGEVPGPDPRSLPLSDGGVLRLARGFEGEYDVSVRPPGLALSEAVGVLGEEDLAIHLGLKDRREPKTRLETGTVVRRRVHEAPGARQCFLTVRAPHIARHVRAGQFANLRADGRGRGFLPGYHVVEDWTELQGSPNGRPDTLHLSRLPMSVQGAFPVLAGPWAAETRLLPHLPRLVRHLLRPAGCDHLEFGLKVVGHGTQALADVQEGETLEILGPLGLEAPLPLEYRRVLLVAGGIGLTALSLLAERLRRRGDEVRLLVGARDRDQLYPSADAPDRFIAPAYEQMGVPVEPVTEQQDSRFVTDRLQELLASSQTPTYDAVYSCGPWVMMKKVAALCRVAAMPCWVMLEQRMECGIGVCMSCVCATLNSDGSGDWSPTRVCRHGPTFNALDVCWE